jgi:hypothetical protein
MAALSEIRARLALLLLAVAATVCLVAAGCGGDDAPAATDMPEPRTAPAFAEYVAALIAEADDPADCRRLAKIDRRSSARLPCPAPEPLREQMDAFELIDSQLFNADRSAVVDYDHGDPTKPTAMVLLLDYDQHWTVQHLDLNSKQRPANGPTEGTGHIKRTIRGYEAAVRARDCETIIRLTYRPAGAPRPSCEDELAATATLAMVLKADPSQRPAFNGGNRDFGFYSMTAYHPRATHHTFTTIRTRLGGADRYFVSDVVRDEG